MDPVDLSTPVVVGDVVVGVWSGCLSFAQQLLFRYLCCSLFVEFTSRFGSSPYSESANTFSAIDFIPY